ncbi:MAG TPA: DUF1566 domain-containing protein [Candidatus Binataceae bacterium]|nr:DUF1566 domain-containing protein [Candidatus Binataceae bacterium]
MTKTSLTFIALCAALLWVGAVHAQTDSSLTCPQPSGPLVGPRYQDNGNGTITDNQTGLMWEKKTGVPGVIPRTPNVHDANNRYSWSRAPSTNPGGTAFGSFVGTLNYGQSNNGHTSTGCFANYCDWRLPTIVELQAIVDNNASGCGANSACIDGTFGPTQRRFYWSSSTFANGLSDAWGVDFGVGDTERNDKNASFYVRAVRCGAVK